MSKMQIIIIAAVGVISLGGGLGLALMTRWRMHSLSPRQILPRKLPKTEQPKPASGELDSTLNQKTISEKQLKLLVQSLRTRITEYDKKEQDIVVRQQQVQSAQDMLLKDVNDLNTLRVQLAGEAAAIKEDRLKLENAQIAIKSDELANLKKTATIYDKMDTASAAKILINMCTSRQIEDAVKILNYMSERNAAKVLGEIGTTDPKIATDLCQMLKRLKEVK